MAPGGPLLGQMAKRICVATNVPTGAQRVRDDGGRDLTILNAIAAGDRLTQRELARELGVAVSLANLSIRRLVRQGLVRVVACHPTKSRYFLTPKGAEERSRLACTQLEWSFTRYQELRDQVRRILQPHVDSGARRFAIWGAGNAAEVAYICLLDSGLDEIAVFAGDGVRVFLGRPVREMGGFIPEEFDRIVIASLDFTESGGRISAELANRGVPTDKIVSLVGPAGHVESPLSDSARAV